MSQRRPRVKAMSDLLEYDNIVEYRMIKNLVGVSGFVFRKKIIDYLRETKLIKTEVGIYDLDDAEILTALSKLKEYRRVFFSKEVPHYRQTGDTCGACCLMMAEKYLLDQPALEKENEDLIHEKSKSRLTDGDVFSLLANEAVGSGLETKLIHAEEDYFSNKLQYIEKDLFGRLMEEYLAGVKAGGKEGLVSETGVNISSQLLEEYLDDGYLVILAVMHGDYLHSVLLTGHGNDSFMVNNPLRTEKTIVNKRVIEKISKTPIGSWFIAIKKNSDNLQKLMNRLPEFRDRSSKYLAHIINKGGPLKNQS